MHRALRQPIPRCLTHTLADNMPLFLQPFEMLFQGVAAGAGQADHIAHGHAATAAGKTLEYPIGTVARVKVQGRTFYFVAMSRLNAQGNASSSSREVEDALSFLWLFILNSGELKNLSVPLIGTGRGRTGIPRKKMCERIAQSFADASKNQIFSNKLSIFIRSEDAENFGVNLYQIRDYLVQSLHV